MTNLFMTTNELPLNTHIEKNNKTISLRFIPLCVQRKKEKVAKSIYNSNKCVINIRQKVGEKTFSYSIKTLDYFPSHVAVIIIPVTKFKRHKKHGISM